jgi:hypothetical protein
MTKKEVLRFFRNNTMNWIPMTGDEKKPSKESIRKAWKDLVFSLVEKGDLDQKAFTWKDPFICKQMI